MMMMNCAYTLVFVVAVVVVVVDMMG